MSSIEAGIPTANEFLSLTDLDIDGGESDDDLQKCELPKHTPMNMNMDCYLNSRFSFAVMGVAPLKKWEEEHLHSAQLSFGSKDAKERHAKKEKQLHA